MLLRAIQPQDAETCARIFFDAFHGIASAHNFPPDIPAFDTALGLFQSITQDPNIYGVVAEQNGGIVGSNFLWHGDAVHAVGPISVSPNVQGSGVGRALMQAVIERGSGAPGIRLLQDAFNCRSMSLYASLGFDVKEPIAMLFGLPKSRPQSDATARPFQPADLDACADLCRRVHGFARSAELAHAMPALQPYVLERGGRITAYATSLHFWIAAHAAAESDDDLKDLILGVAALTNEPMSFLFPTRQAKLHRWLLSEGFRMVKPMTLMAKGEYHEPRGAWFPSVLY